MIDLHAHILPGLDDGPPDLEGSLALARAAVAAGTTTIVATPHIDMAFGLHAADRDAPLATLREGLQREGIPLKVEPGAEIEIGRYLDLGADELETLTMGGGPYLMLEPPLSVAGGAFDKFLESLLGRGVRVLIAHPERCPAFQSRPERLAELVAAGALGQVTAGSLAGRFGGRVREVALRMLADGVVHVLASDTHDANNRGPALLEGLEAAERDLPGSAALADWLTVDVPSAILSGGTVPARPPVAMEPPRRSWRRRVLGRG